MTIAEISSSLRPRRLGAFLTAVVLLVAGGQAAVAVAAVTATVNTGSSLPLNVRAQATTASTVVKTVAQGSTISLGCYSRGQTVQGGPWNMTSDLWYQLADKSGYVWDGMVYTGSNDPVTPACSGDTPTAEFRMPFTKGQTWIVTQAPGGSYSHSDQWNRYAIDLGRSGGAATTENQPVLAGAGGTVKFAGWAQGGGGIQVLIDHGNNRCSQYLHMNAWYLDAGQKVNRGTPIGKVGGTGDGVYGRWAPHLHWGIVNCTTWESIATPRTLEAGTNYYQGRAIVSQNG